MFEYIKKIIENPKTKSPRTHSFVVVISSISLCIGFLSTTGAHLFGAEISESIILGLAGILATLASANYAVGKMKREEEKGEQ